MVKKVNKLMTILTLVGAGVVGVNSVETVATNVYGAYETPNAYYLDTYWEYWSITTPAEDEPYFEILSVGYDGDLSKSNIQYYMENIYELFGGKDVYINLNGTFNLFFADSNYEHLHNKTFGNINANGILIANNRLIFMLDGRVSANYHRSNILYWLDGSPYLYIVRNMSSNEYLQGYEVGFNNGYDDGEIYGYNRGKEDYGIMFDGDWQTAEWYGDYMYDKGLNETDATGFGGLLTAVFGGLGSLLSIEILPGIYIGAIIAVPLVFGIVFFILGKRKGD